MRENGSVIGPICVVKFGSRKMRFNHRIEAFQASISVEIPTKALQE